MRCESIILFCGMVLICHSKLAPILLQQLILFLNFALRKKWELRIDLGWSMLVRLVYTYSKEMNKRILLICEPIQSSGVHPNVWFAWRGVKSFILSRGTFSVCLLKLVPILLQKLILYLNFALSKKWELGSDLWWSKLVRMVGTWSKEMNKLFLLIFVPIHSSGVHTSVICVRRCKELYFLMEHSFNLPP
jgi:hypothetical protein